MERSGIVRSNLVTLHLDGRAALVAVRGTRPP